MDFFTAQDEARKKTTLLITLFALAVLLLVVLTNLFLMAAMAIAAGEPDPGRLSGLEHLMQQFSWMRFAAIGAAVLLVILLGSLFRSWTMGRGGKAVAEMMGATLITPDSRNPDYRRLLNIVEEMAIASGTTVPLVYVMQKEPAINAFAAGITAGDAAIVVTRGCLQQLSRDELQGIVAHEFSHILNGDMRLNMRLVGILFGILMLGLIGRFMLRTAGGSRRGSTARRGNGLPWMALGGGLFILGYAGTFIGNLIKASVSRQREYLADASAVQFTRDPQGIGGALIKIGALPGGSLLRSADAAELSHAYFSEGVRVRYLTMLATHPPLEERIRRVLPHWDGIFPREHGVVKEPLRGESQAAAADDKNANVKTAAATTILLELLRRIGQSPGPDAGSIASAAVLVGRIPQTLLENSRDPYGARAVMFALLIDNSADTAARQLMALQMQAGDDVIRLTQRLLPMIRRLRPQLRLAVIEMATPALRELSARQLALFRESIDLLIRFDAETTLFEWTLQKIVMATLSVDHGKGDLVREPRRTLTQLLPECAILLSVVARAASRGDAEAAGSFQAAIDELQTAGIQLFDSRVATFEALDDAIGKLNQLKPLHKRRLLRACTVCVAADDSVAPAELELLRAISLLLNGPMPLPDDSNLRLGSAAHFHV
ncbi:MAG: M48 family metallopeptidase [Pseudomonadota bacterium]